jgi:hypothetical protein
MDVQKLQTGIYINGRNRLTLSMDGEDEITINDQNHVHMEFTNFLIIPCPTRESAVDVTMLHFKYKWISRWLVKQLLKILK